MTSRPPGDPAYPPVSYAAVGPPEVPQDERTLAVLAHVLGAFVSFLAPLIIYLTRDRRDYAKAQAAQALNFTVLIGYVVAAALTPVLIGFLLFPIVLVWSVVLAIIAGVRTSRGEPWVYPMTIRFLRA